MNSIINPGVALVLFLVGLLAPHLSAQVGKNVEPLTGRDSLSLEEAVLLAMQHSPEIARLDADLADKLGRAAEIAVKENPSIKLSGGRMEERDGRGSVFEFEAEQPLRPSDFGLRRTYAAALRATASLEQQAEILSVLNNTAVTFYRAWTLQERATSLTAAREQADEVLATISQQLEAGQSNISERHLFAAEAAQFAAELAAVRGERAGAIADLERATGLNLSGARFLAPVLPAPPPVAALVAFADERSGLRRLALARQAAAAKALKVAKADAVFPEFAPGLTTSYESRNDESVVALTFAARLPIWDRNQGEVTRARGALRAAEKELAAVEGANLGRWIAARRAQLIYLQARAQAYRSHVIPAYRAAYQAALEQFRAGQATTLQLFQVQQRLVEAQEKAGTYGVEALSARTQLEQLIGGRLEEVGHSGGGK